MADIFAALDESFVNIEKNNQPYVWQCKNYLVTSFFEVPVPTPPGSTVRYSFATVDGDIAFGVKFSSHNHADETIIETSRVPSDIETITGSYKSQRDGTLTFIFDNTFSWFNAKQLTYHVELSQPAFTVADNLRCLRSRKMLQSLTDDTRKAELRLIRCQDRMGVLKEEADNIEEKISLLQSELESKKSSLAAAFVESEEMTNRILINLEKKNGLCIRCLDKKLLSLVIEYLGGRKSSVSAVCKYWYLCAKELDQQGGQSSSTQLTNGNKE